MLMNDPRLPLYMTKNADDITNEKGVTTPKGSVYCGIMLPAAGPIWTEATPAR